MPFVKLSGIAYIAASVLFVLSLRGLSRQETARRGNGFGMVGMALAVVATALSVLFPVGRPALDSGEAAASSAAWIFGQPALGASLVVGGLVGAVLAARVAMTSMPELIAILHSFVGAAAVLVGFGSHLNAHAAVSAAAVVVHRLEIGVGIVVGAVTFTGSVVAFFKLRGTLGSKPLLLPGRHFLNAVLLLLSALAIALYVHERPPLGTPSPTVLLMALTAIASVLGVHLVMAIGGGDMPVVVSLLNSYSGWAAAVAGFMLSNDLLIITGALVGSSGAILSTIMCKAMNRSIWSVVFGGFGADSGAKPAAGAVPAGKVNETSAEATAQLLLAAKKVIIIPGYGMAVAQAQHAVQEITTLLANRGTQVRYAIHPVAGRLPGHMNVLLAEADVSYEIVKEIDEINETFGETDVVVVIGANDIVNPSALSDPASPIYGMPVLEAWKAARVVMLKRGMAAGYAGVDNPLCYRENTLMLFGDAKKSVLQVLEALRAG